MKYIARFTYSTQVTGYEYAVVSKVFECSDTSTIGEIMEAFRAQAVGGYIRCDIECVEQIVTPQEVRP